MRFRALMILALLSQQTAYVVTFLSQKQGIEVLSGYFYLFNAFTHCLLWFGFVFANKKDSWSRRLMFYGIVLSGNQLVDEISRKAQETQANEILLGLLILLHVLFSIGYDYGRKSRS